MAQLSCSKKVSEFKNQRRQKGFSLLDVIFAIGIALIGLVGVLGLLRYVIVASRVSLDKFVANSLAQEGIEIVRAIRDSNWLSGQAWNNGLAAGCWRVQYDATALTASIVCNDSTKLLRDNRGYYNYSSGQTTKFVRVISITNDVDSQAPGENIGVISQVSWTGTPGTSAVTIEDRLYNWQP